MSAHQKRVVPKPELDQQLSNALKDTFPASDAVTIGAPTSRQPDRPAHRRAPLIDKQLVKDLAQKAGRKSRQKDN